MYFVMIFLYQIQFFSSVHLKCADQRIYLFIKLTKFYLLIVIIDQPTIDRRSLQIVNESEKISLTRDIVSNPVSNVSWYYGTQLLKTQPSVTTATYTIENTTCTDTKNYTLLVSNGIGNTVEALVELIVNCKILISLNHLEYICVIVIIVVLFFLVFVFLFFFVFLIENH